ncbi:MAG: hypothetical protein KTR24_00315 [Saprospiraceae bacterium]|nr:hypothetical protein [Saprospiraceae bacterium]
MNTLLVGSIFSLGAFGQASKAGVHKHRCASEKYLEHRLQTDPDFSKQYAYWVSQSNTARSQTQALLCGDSNSVVIPVAVHYDGNLDCTDLSCLIETAEAQISVMNEAFSASNSDLSTYTTDLSETCPEGYPLSYAPEPDNGSCIQFCLASQNHPAGSGLADGDPAITIRQHGWPSAGSTWSGYLNIFVSDVAPTGVASDVIGVSVLPGSANGDGFWVKASVFGAPGQSCFSGAILNSSTNYGMGKTAVHEAGHYLGLLHTFNGACGDADQNPPTPTGVSLTIDDTPAQEESTDGCVTVTSCMDAPKSCMGAYTPFWSYMDYSFDACLYMFSADQSAVVNAWANALPWHQSATKCAVPAPEFSSVPCPCIISEAGLELGNCANGRFTFTLNPSGTMLGSSYSISGDIQQSGIEYGTAQTFDNGGIGFSIDSVYSIRIEDAGNTDCSLTLLINAPCQVYTCETAREIVVDDCHLAPGPSFGEGANNDSGQEAAQHANWFTFTAPRDGQIEIFSCGQFVDTRLWVYSGTCANLTEEAASDDDCDLGDGSNDYASIANLDVLEGQHYYIEWDDVWSDQSFEFYVLYADDVGEDCTDAIPILDNGIYLASGPNSGSGATPSIQPPATHANWYRYVAPSDGILNVRSCFGGSDTRLHVHSGGCGSLSLISSSDDDCATGAGVEYASAVEGLAVTTGQELYLEWDDIWSSVGFKFELEFLPSCQTVLDLSTGSLSNVLYQAGEVILSRNVIDGDVTFEAGESVELSEPFEVPEASLFVARIAPCGMARDQTRSVLNLFADKYFR